MPKHENNALQEKIYNQFEKGTFSVECAPCLWHFPSKEEEQHTFRTIPREHW